MADPESTKPFVVKKNPWTGIIISAVAVIGVLGFIFFGVTRMSDTVTGNWLNGRITKKEFKPLAEKLISVGTGGVRQQESKGRFYFEIAVESSDRTYTVYVDEPTYRSHDVGDQFKFLKAPVPKVE